MDKKECDKDTSTSESTVTKKNKHIKKELEIRDAFYVLHSFTFPSAFPNEKSSRDHSL